MMHQNCGLCQSKVSTACGLAAASEGLRMHCIIIHIPMNLSQGVSLLLARAPVLWPEASSPIPTLSTDRVQLLNRTLEQFYTIQEDLTHRPAATTVLSSQVKIFIRQDKLCSIGFQIKPFSCLNLHMKLKLLVIQISIVYLALISIQIQ